MRLMVLSESDFPYVLDSLEDKQKLLAMFDESGQFNILDAINHFPLEVSLRCLRVIRPSDKWLRGLAWLFVTGTSIGKLHHDQTESDLCAISWGDLSSERSSEEIALAYSVLQNNTHSFLRPTLFRDAATAPICGFREGIFLCDKFYGFEEKFRLECKERFINVLSRGFENENRKDSK